MATPADLPENLHGAIADIVGALEDMDPYVAAAWVAQFMATLPPSPTPQRQGDHNKNLVYSQHADHKRGVCIAWYARAADARRAVEATNSYVAAIEAAKEAQAGNLSAAAISPGVVELCASAPTAAANLFFDQLCYALRSIERDAQEELVTRFTALLWHGVDVAADEAG